MPAAASRFMARRFGYKPLFPVFSYLLNFLTCVFSRPGDDELDDAHQTEAAVFQDFNSGLTHEGIHPVIDMLACESDRGTIEEIHEGPDDRALDPHVIEKEDPAVRFRDASDLPQARNGVRHGAEHEGRRDRVEGLVREGEGAEIRFLEVTFLLCSRARSRAFRSMAPERSAAVTRASAG